jgi:hypothetical protein
MAKNCEHQNPLQRDGTSQAQRQLPDLQPNAIQLDNRSAEDLLLFAYRYAAELKFFDLDGSTDENWQVFFEQINGKSLEEIEAQSDNEPHFALFLCFLKLFQHAQGQLNQITDKHLNFYYRQVLQIKEHAPRPDHVHLIFELAKNIDQVFLPKGTAFNGGKDASGKIRNYEVTEDTLVNNAEVTHLRSVYKRNKKIYFAPQTNSADGMGAEFEEENTSWSAFGSTELPRAALGFAMASPVLLLQEGRRKVRLILNLTSSANFPTTLDSGILSNIKMYASGEKEWIGPFIAADESAFAYNDGRTHPQLKLEFDINSEDDPILPYDPNVLSGNFDTLSPLIRVIFEPMEEGDLFFDLQNATIRSMKIEVEVKDMKEMQLENDFGALDGSKAFLPFGPRPVKGSNFFIGSDEAFTKKLKDFKLHLQWLNKPNSLLTHYSAYNNSALKDNNFTANLWILDKKNWERPSDYALFSTYSNKKTISKDFTSTSDSTGQRLSKTSRHIEHLHSKVLLVKNQVNPFFERAVSPRRKKSSNKAAKRRLAKRRKRPARIKTKLTAAQRDGFIKLSLLQDFGHQAYPTVYTLAIAKNTDDNTGNDVSIPNEPYTPSIESISLDYNATTETVKFQTTRATDGAYRKKEIQFFHITPFGQAERHPYLNTLLPFNTNSKTNLLPAFQNEGEFYIGLEKVNPGEQISLLLQVAEGSADPDKQPATVHWHCLVQNQWMPLKDEFILADHTNGLLTSGIIKINLPKVADDRNSILEEDLIWLRASVQQDTDSVAKLIGVHPQAITATFTSNENSLEHLSTALPPMTIGKMINRLAQVKKVKQPYASFDGAPRESSSAYYTRVSERLRHKNRAVTIWDYEHLVLQEFPSVYKVKCLNHSSLDQEIAPGHVTVLVIPNLRNQNAPDPLKPKVPSNTLAEIESFLGQRASRFTQIQAQNPDYEEIRLQVQVTFHQQFEEGFYKKVLNQDLINFFTPWAFQADVDIEFGGAIHKSTIINFLETLEYIDHVDDLKMFHINKANVSSLVKTEVAASNSRAILVSTKQHSINPE